MTVAMDEVAPLAGAWIEISDKWHGPSITRVAPLAGAWIEIPKKSNNLCVFTGRSPRGSVE